METAGIDAKDDGVDDFDEIEGLVENIEDSLELLLPDAADDCESCGDMGSAPHGRIAGDGGIGRGIGEMRVSG